MEKLANKLSVLIAKQQNSSEEQRRVIEYGLTAMLQMITIFIIILVSGLLLGAFFEAIVIFCAVGFLRKSTGGAHSSTMIGCTVFSCINIICLSLFAHYGAQYIPTMYILLLGGFAYIVCFIIAYKKVPVDCENKRIRKPEKIKRLRTQSFIKIILYALMSFAWVLISKNSLLSLSVFLAFNLSTAWQVFTLTDLGSKFICFFDRPRN